MPLDDRTRTLNRRFGTGTAPEVLEHAISNLGQVALVSSFGAESVVLLHMAAQINPLVPVLFIDTEMLFDETLQYQRDIARFLGLQDVRVIKAERANLFERDNENLLHKHDPDACCALRKTRPLQMALRDFDGWITGRKRYQGGQRLALEYFESERPLGVLPRIKVNPLVHWDAADLSAYIMSHKLPRHPLVAKGYPSIGCAPCTKPVGFGGDPRAGRWTDQGKTECGIHFEDNEIVRHSA
ncbi:MAG: phosphoadenylyl-sulfate reductase [Octadecabacter sp.]|nr:phosphoadenylyl-sulfate reductase [Octadecabacter sp.]